MKDKYNYEKEWCYTGWYMGFIPVWINDLENEPLRMAARFKWAELLMDFADYFMNNGYGVKVKPTKRVNNHV